VDKNTIPNPEIISMTYFEYICYCSTKKEFSETPYLLWFDRMLSLCLKDDNSFENPIKSIERYKYDGKRKPYFEIAGEKYISKDFDELRKIICEQNYVDLPDENISKEVRDSLEEARRYKNKLMGNGKGVGLEDYIVSLSIATGWELDYVYNMPIRKFLKAIRRMDNLIHYKIYLAASMSGMVEFKDKSFIKHWLSSIEDENKYSDVSMELNAAKDMISMESAKRRK
jgi:hypothetical protein